MFYSCIPPQIKEEKKERREKENEIYQCYPKMKEVIWMKEKKVHTLGAL